MITISVNEFRAEYRCSLRRIRKAIQDGELDSIQMEYFCKNSNIPKLRTEIIINSKVENFKIIERKSNLLQGYLNEKTDWNRDTGQTEYPSNDIYKSYDGFLDTLSIHSDKFRF